MSNSPLPSRTLFSISDGTARETRPRWQRKRKAPLPGQMRPRLLEHIISQHLSARSHRLCIRATLENRVAHGICVFLQRGVIYQMAGEECLLSRQSCISLPAGSRSSAEPKFISREERREGGTLVRRARSSRDISRFKCPALHSRV